MNIISRVAATATAVVSISALGLPLAASATASHGYYGGSGKIRVCVQGLRGGEADVYVDGRSSELSGGECTVFRGLSRGRIYRVSADAGRGCRIFEEEKYARASRDPRTVVFFGRCFGGGGWNHGGGDEHGGGWNRGGGDDNNGGRDEHGGGWNRGGERDGMDGPRR